jgi:predicted DNA-binding transcriptional regulator
MNDQRRLQRNRRSPSPPPMRLTGRDVDILQALADYRVLRQDQIQVLFFGSKSTAQYRLSHLFQHGFLKRHFLPVYAGWSPTLYTLDKAGVSVLREQRQIADKLWTGEVGQEFLNHTLAINDVRIAFTIGCHLAGYTLVSWLTEFHLKADYDRVPVRDAQGRIRQVSLIPDGYGVLETPRGRAAFFLEMDRGTMTTSRFQTKIKAYREYVRSNRYTERYQSKSLRVLTVVPSQKRLLNLKQSAEPIELPNERLFWFAVQQDIHAQSVLHDPIWQLAGSEVRHTFIPKS